MASLVPLVLALPVLLPTLQEEPPPILSLRERAAVMDGWLERRLETLAPRLLREAGADLWIVLAREYAEDPVIETMLPATWMAARRRTILLLHDPNPPEVEGELLPLQRLAVARYDVGRFFRTAWNPSVQPDQWARLGELVRELDPARIAVNVDPVFALGDGLTVSQHDELVRALGEHAGRLTTDHHLPILWLETRIPEEMAVYPSVVALAHRILADGLSSDTIEPGVTTTDDLAWWFRERIAGWKLGAWFHPSVSVQRLESGEHSGSFATKPGPTTILPGDLLHVDLGITYLGLNTDTQQHAYVLGEGEEEAPEGLRRALAIGNRLQDVLMGTFRTGLTGNEILAGALRLAGEEGIDATIYTHPLGYHGHAAGPTIGLWDQQGGVPGSGDYPLHPDTVWAIELNARVPVPEWNDQAVRVMLEEDAFFDGEACRFLDGRQTELFLVR